MQAAAKKATLLLVLSLSCVCNLGHGFLFEAFNDFLNIRPPLSNVQDASAKQVGLPRALNLTQLLQANTSSSVQAASNLRAADSGNSSENANQPRISILPQSQHRDDVTQSVVRPLPPSSGSFRSTAGSCFTATNRGCAEVPPIRTRNVQGGRIVDDLNISALSGMLAKLDPVRGLLEKTLEGWQPPQIVVIGGESSGKSTILNQLAMMPLLPRADKFCTRLPIEIRLRRSEEIESVLEVRNELTDEVEKNYSISTENAESKVREEMDALVEQCTNDEFGLSSDRKIVLRISKPDLPSLDLVDLPGIVTVPEQKAEKTRCMVRRYLKESNGNLLVLCVVKATEDLTQSVALQMIDELKLQDKCTGVFTFCDHLNAKRFENLRDRVVYPTSNHPVKLLKNGWVATSNYRPEKPSVNRSDKLKQQALEEKQFFVNNGMEDLVKKKLATTPALVDRLHVMYNEQLMGTWMPQTVRLFEKKIRGCDAANALLGLPPPNLVDADTLRTSAVECAQSLLRSLGTSHQHGALTCHFLSEFCYFSILGPVHKMVRTFFFDGSHDPVARVPSWTNTMEVSEHGTSWEDFLDLEMRIKHSGNQRETLNCTRYKMQLPPDSLRTWSSACRLGMQDLCDASLMALRNETWVHKVEHCLRAQQTEREAPPANMQAIDESGALTSDTVSELNKQNENQNQQTRQRELRVKRVSQAEKEVHDAPFQLSRFPHFISEIGFRVEAQGKKIIDATSKEIAKYLTTFFSLTSPRVTYDLQPDMSCRVSFDLNQLATDLVLEVAGANEEMVNYLKKELPSQLAAMAAEAGEDVWEEECAGRREELAEEKATLCAVFGRMVEALSDDSDAPASTTLLWMIDMLRLSPYPPLLAKCSSELRAFAAANPEIAEEFKHEIQKVLDADLPGPTCPQPSTKEALSTELAE